MGGGWELYQIDDPLTRMEEVQTPEPIEQIARRELGPGGVWEQPGPAQEDALLASFLDEAHGTSGERQDAAGDSAPAAADSGAVPLVDLLDPGAAAVTVPGPTPLVVRSAPGDAGGADPDTQRLTLTDVRAATAYDLPDRDSLASQPYRIKWAPDFVGASPFFASNVGFAGSAQIALSDILSNHVIQIGASVYGSLDESDLFLGYYNLAHRTNWGISAFQFRNDFGVFTAQDRIGFESQIYRGVQGVVSRPFSKFSRLELSARGVAVSSTVFDQSFESGFVTTQEVDSDLLYFAQPQIALVTDNVAWGYNGPMHGHRTRIQTGQAFGDVQFNTTLGDLRKYIPLGSTVVLATRVIGGASVGNTPQIFRVGGPETLRGVGYGALEGDTLGLLNIEMRFPLVETLRLGWPLRIGLGGIQGVLFFDAGGAWSEGVRVFRNGRLDDVTAGYGTGLRLGLGYFALKYDLAQRTDLKSRVGDSRSYFSIGVDF
jgi:hypothetical protein